MFVKHRLRLAKAVLFFLCYLEFPKELLSLTVQLYTKNADCDVFWGQLGQLGRSLQPNRRLLAKPPSWLSESMP